MVSTSTCFFYQQLPDAARIREGNLQSTQSSLLSPTWLMARSLQLPNLATKIHVYRCPADWSMTYHYLDLYIPLEKDTAEPKWLDIKVVFLESMFP